MLTDDKPVPLADLIEEAADTVLSSTGRTAEGKRIPSCCAVWKHMRNTFGVDEAVTRRRCAAEGVFDDLVEEMGLFMGFASYGRSVRERQDTRHAWLYLVAQVARERNLLV
jgi:hypothetical protein